MPRNHAHRRTRSRMPGKKSHQCVVAALVVFPLSLNAGSGPITTVADTAAPRARAAVQLHQEPLVGSRSAQRFESVGGVESVPPAGLPEGRERTVKVTSPKGSRSWTASALAEHGLPAAAARAYRTAARTISGTDASCQLPWTLLAGIGRVESDHGRYGGSVLADNGVSHPLIIGVPLNGIGPVAAIRDTDRGLLDKDKVWDRAVGPMQFIPSTWRGAGRDGDGDGVSTPNDIDDAALAAASYLCSGSGSVLGVSAMRGAVYRYNQSEEYVDLVLAFEAGYRTGVFVMPSPPPPPPPPPVEETGPAKKRPVRADADRTPARPRADRTKRPSPPKKASTSVTTSRPKATTSARPAATPVKKPRAADRDGSSSGSKGSTGSVGSTGSKGATASPSPSPSTSPSATPKPTPSGIEGTLTACGSGWCLHDTGEGADFTLDFGSVDETTRQKIDALVGTTVRLGVTHEGGRAVVQTINGTPYR